MMKKAMVFVILVLLIFTSNVLLMGCSGDTRLDEGETPVPTQTVALMDTPTVGPNFPEIATVDLDRQEVPRYESIEFILAFEAEYKNPYDARQIRLSGTFQGPDGTEVTVPGFWDGVDNWRVRFTPSLEGEWSYALEVWDKNGTSAPSTGKFQVTSSDLHGWLQVGSWVNPDYSSRYFVYHDGTPFYGLGHCDALNILVDGFDADEGVGLLTTMSEVGENYVVWWPLYSNSPIKNEYDSYSVPDMSMIDLIVQDAQRKGIFLIFTIWDHPQLRDSSHSWADGRWVGYNGFRNLVDLDSFFTSVEAWVWQENFYRYIIARWGYSPAIGMWQTVSEINGTNAYEQTDNWHRSVNVYFVENDPYRHPTTASMSGDIDWPEGFHAMDVPQVHVYALEEGALKAADIIAYWTTLMWEMQEKPNWVGEFGVSGGANYPELFHNSIWAALASGAAMTPAEWNSAGAWGHMTQEMYADIGRLGFFVTDIPLAEWKPNVVEIKVDDPQVRGWGIAGEGGGLFWVQDFSLEGSSISEVRETQIVRSGVQVEINGIAPGTYLVHPYDTWKGVFLASYDLECLREEICAIVLPTFERDLALKLERK
jgi:hypothetical protein